MTGALVVAPISLALATGLGCALVRSPGARRVVAFVGASALVLGAAVLVAVVGRDGPLRTSLGSWDAPFGIELVADSVGAPMTLVAALVTLLALIFQQSDADPAEETRTLHPLLFALVAGVIGTFLTNDLFNLYVWFEVMLLSALGLLALGGGARELDATAKYFVLNALGTLFFLVGIGLVYASTGHLNMTALAAASSAEEATRWLPFVGILVVAFVVKAGAFPVFAWLPASYPALPAPLLSLFAGLLTKVGVFVLLRALGDVFVSAPRLIGEALGWAGALSMIVGALGAIHHYDTRRILSFHIVSQVGYMLFGIALGTEGARIATMYYVLHHIAAKSNLFLLAAVVAKLSGSYDLRRSGGLYTTHPGLALLFLISALSMVGVPPLSGFWAKFMLLREGVAEARFVWTAAAVATGFLTLFSMMKIWFSAFLGDRAPARAEGGARAEGSGSESERGLRLGPAYGAIAAFAAITLALGVSPEPVLDYLRGGPR